MIAHIISLYPPQSHVFVVVFFFFTISFCFLSFLLICVPVSFVRVCMWRRMQNYSNKAVNIELRPPAHGISRDAKTVASLNSLRQSPWKLAMG